MTCARKTGICQKENFVKSATLALLVLAASLSSWSLTDVPGNAVKSSKHYRESGVGNATGRSGSANMSARALLDKDGNTVVEVTTGALDSSSTPPGSFRKVQVKALSPAGDALSVDNYFPSTGGYYKFVSPSLYEAEKIQVQGNISGIDRNRTDVVTVVETVKMRPDLVVDKLTFPSSAIVSHSVNISATLWEGNGDAAANTTCVLAIDGNNVDQMNNVWVDAGGSVSCVFAYTFNAPGNHTIQVTAANVVPGDWDTSNNSSSGTINITNPTSAETASASFEDDNGGFPLSRITTSKQWLNGNLVVDVSDTEGKSGRTQLSNTKFSSSGCTGHTDAVQWQFPVGVMYSETMDGLPVYSVTDAVISGYSVTFAGNNSLLCHGIVAREDRHYGSSNAGDHWSYLESSQFYDSAGNLLSSAQSVQNQRFAGDVTYLSYGYQCYYWNNPTQTCTSPTDYYVWNSPFHDVYGTVVPVGSTWVPSVDTRDAEGATFSGSISVPLSSTLLTKNQPERCFNFGPDSDGFYYQNCSSSSSEYTVTKGSGSN